MKIENLYLIGTAIILSVVLLTTLVYFQNRTRTPELLSDTNKEIRGPLVGEEQELNKKTNNMNPNEELNKNNGNINPTAIIYTNKGDIELEIFADKMPITANNFMSLAESGFYDNTKFHRVIEGFMIQGGDPNTKGNDESLYGTGGPAENVQDEFVKDEVLTNTRGTIAMANTGQPNSGGSQFFINLGDNSYLDFDKPPFTSKHPVFGKVISGMDVVDEIASTETKDRDIPVDPIIVRTIGIENW